MPTVRVCLMGADGKLAGPAEASKVARTDAEWQKQLTPEQYRVARRKGTEPAFCGGLPDSQQPGKEQGVYACVCCNLPLFASNAKFESGTGWPSFVAPVAAENIGERVDRSLGMERRELVCRRCDAHLGHVFDDGPPPTGLRYCLNSAVLRFVSDDQLKSLAETPPAAQSRPASEASSTAKATPATAAADPGKPQRAEAIFAGGCFWCVEAVFEQLDGVVDAISGYAGGTAETANYEAVCTGRTGHAEAVKIVYDPRKISYERLLKVHFATHDPTTVNRQGNDFGPQYRSVVFYGNQREKDLAAAMVADLTDAKVYAAPIVTKLEPATTFFAAEIKHQGYVACHLSEPYVRAAALPKVEKVREKFKDLLKPQEASPTH